MVLQDMEKETKMSNQSQHHTSNITTNKKRHLSPPLGWFRTITILTALFVAFSFALVNLESVAEAASPPDVNGLFYGDGDNNDYVLYGMSEYGSGLYIYFDNPIIYVALVVTRDVNDNVFGNRPYTQNAGWGPPRGAGQLVNSEYASFVLKCTTAPMEWSWTQGYARQEAGVWYSDEGGQGSGTPPPGYDSSSSFAWNINTYMSSYPSVAWDLYNGNGSGTAIGNWKSPFDTGSPNTVIGLDGYPATGPIVFSSQYNYEWPMVYEWSADLSGCGSNAIFVLAGESHHSPSKNDDENDDFPEDPDPQPLTDYGDLPDTYSTLKASNGARHTLTINGAYLGTKPDPELDGQPSSDATGDMASDNDEDGVNRTGATLWQPGNTVQLRLNVQGSTPTADVGIWIDWNGDGNFDEANEFYSFIDLPTGGNSIVNILIPPNYNAGDSVNVRTRIFTDQADAPGGSLDAGDYEGMAASGEVEDNQWFFGPTAITLVNATTGSQETSLIIVLGLTAVALLVTTLYIGRRQERLSGK
jgi:hypothetical protein